jgi:cysteine synthase
VLVHDDDCVMGLKVLQDGAAALTAELGVKAAAAKSLRGLFGISGLCNVLGAIKLAKALKLGPKQNVVTIATDGFDRYPSVMVDLGKRMGRIDDQSVDERVLGRWAREVFRGADAEEVLDVRGKKQKDRLFAQKREVWSLFGYGAHALDAMKKQAFWDKEFAEIPAMDRAIAKLQRA